jgi:1-acyl-sn-glycerol-3-phosphate acyltransferase
MESRAKGLWGQAMRYLKIAWLGFWVSLVTSVLAFPVVLAARLDPTQRKADSICRLWARILLAGMGVKIRGSGLERIDQGSSHVIISNHQSHFDILALVTVLPVSIRWVIKKELRKIPLFGYATEAMRNVYVDRSDPAQAVQSLQEGIRTLPPGCSLLFFAEGTRSPDGRIGAFKKGGFRTARIVQWPLLPVVVRGSRRILPRDEMEFRSGTIEVEVLDPVSREDVQALPWQELMESVRQRMVACFEHPESRDPQR